MPKIILVFLKKIFLKIFMYTYIIAVSSCMILNSELICCFCLIIFPIWDHTQNHMSGYHHTQIIPNNHIIIRCNIFFLSINSSLMIYIFFLFTFQRFLEMNWSLLGILAKSFNLSRLKFSCMASLFFLLLSL